MTKQQQQDPSQGSSALNQTRSTTREEEARLEAERARHESSTDAMYGTHSSMGGETEPEKREHQRRHRTEAGYPGLSGGAQTGLSGSMSQVGEEDPLSNIDEQTDVLSAEAASTEGASSRSNPASSNTTSKPQAEAATSHGGTKPSQPSDANPAAGGPRSKYSPTAKEQSRLSQELGGEAIEDQPGRGKNKR